MRNRSILISCLLFFAGLAGCAGPRMDAGWPEPRPLGQGFKTFRPPGEPSSHVRPTTPSEAPASSLSLRQALACSLMNNPGLAAFSWEVRAREAQALQAGLLPNPELEIEVENFGGSGPSRDFDESEATLQFSQLVELAGKRAKRKRVATIERDLAGWDYEIERVRIFSETSRAFVDVLAAQEHLALSEELVRLAEQVLQVVSERIRAGKVSPVEETRARVSLSSHRIETEKAREDLATARKVLAATWGSTTPAFGKVEGSLEHLPSIPPLEVLVDRVADTPEMARWIVEIEARRASVEMEKATRFPDLTLRGGVRYANESDDTAFVMGLSVPIPAFDRNQRGTLEARYRLAGAEEERRALHVRVQTALVRAYQVLSAARVEAVSLKSEVLPGARIAFEAFGEGFRQGKFGYLDVLDAQRTFFEAKARYIKALAEFHKAVSELERLTGEPLDKVDNAVQSMQKNVGETLHRASDETAMRNVFRSELYGDR